VVAITIEGGVLAVPIEDDLGGLIELGKLGLVTDECESLCEHRVGCSSKCVVLYVRYGSCSKPNGCSGG